MVQEIKLGTAQIAYFGVADASRANGFGLHVAASHEADGKGVYAECFLHADAAGEIKLVYIDAGRSEFPPPREVPSPEISLMLPGATAGDPVGGISTTVEPVDTSGTGMLTVEVEPEPTLDSKIVSIFGQDPSASDLRGSHRFEIKLGPRDSIVWITVSISSRLLVVDCLRRSEHTVGPPRAFTVGGGIPMVEGDLGSRPRLFYSSNGLLSGDPEGAGRGWKTKKPKTGIDGGGSDDGAVILGVHDNDDPLDPIGG